MIFTIVRRELKSLFLSPLAWSLLAIVQLIQAYFFLTLVEAFNNAQPTLAKLPDAPGLAELVVTPLFSNTAVILLLIAPLFTMRMIAEERRNKTLTLLLSAPVSNTEIICGKFLAVSTLFGFTVLLTSFMPLSLLAGGTLDFGKFFANLLALSLLVAAFSAAGLYMSCVGSSPTVAAMNSFGLLLLLWILDWINNYREHASASLSYFSLAKHFQNLQSGLINSVDLIYFGLFISAFLMLSIRRLEHERSPK